MKALRNFILFLTIIYTAFNVFTRLRSDVQIKPLRPYFKHRGPYIFAHRGGAGEAPEHTMAAFNNADAAGVSGFEIDIRLTQDMEIVVMHDLLVDRTSNGVGKVSDLTLEELRALDFGYHFKDANGDYVFRGDDEAKIVTLKELIETFPNQLINIDIKDDPDTIAGKLVPKILSDLIKEFDAEKRILVTSFHGDQIQRFKLHARGKVATGAGVEEVRRGYFLYVLGLGHLYQPNTSTYQIPINFGPLRLDNAHFIQYLTNLNVVVGYWTINDLDEMERLIKNGAHTIVTDYPSLTEHVKETLN